MCTSLGKRGCSQCESKYCSFGAYMCLVECPVQGGEWESILTYTKSFLHSFLHSTSRHASPVIPQMSSRTLEGSLGWGVHAESSVASFCDYFFISPILLRLQIPLVRCTQSRASRERSVQRTSAKEGPANKRGDIATSIQSAPETTIAHSLQGTKSSASFSVMSLLLKSFK